MLLKVLDAPPCHIQHQTKPPTSPPEKTHPVHSNIRLIGYQDVTGEAQNIIINSWRHSPRQQYSTYFVPLVKFFKYNNVNIISLSVQDVPIFLTIQSQRLGYSAMASTRSVLSTIITLDGYKLGDHPLVSKILTGLFNHKSVLPRFVETWDPQIVLDYIVNLPNNEV